jgi:hypothetical protein
LYRWTDRDFFTFKVLQIPASFIVQIAAFSHIQWRRGLRPVGKLPMLSENCQGCWKLSKLSTGGRGGVWRFKMLSGKIFGLLEKNFDLSEKYCPRPPKNMGPTAPHCTDSGFFHLYRSRGFFTFQLTDFGFFLSGFYRFWLFWSRILQIPVFLIPDFITDSGFSHSRL